MQPTGFSRSIFLTYKRAETLLFVERLHSFFRQPTLRVNVRYDVIALEPGGRWWDQLAHEIERADSYGFVISAGSTADLANPNDDSSTCAKEFALARGFNKPLVPILWETPRNGGVLPTALSDLQYVNFEPYRLSNMTDQNAFKIACERLQLALVAAESAWLNESMEWYERLSVWRDMGRNERYLLEARELEKFIDWDRRRPKNIPLAPEHPMLWEFIDLSRQKLGR